MHNRVFYAEVRTDINVFCSKSYSEDPIIRDSTLSYSDLTMYWYRNAGHLYRPSTNQQMTHWLPKDGALKVIDSSIIAVDPARGQDRIAYEAHSSRGFYHSRLDEIKSYRAPFLYVSHFINYIRGNIALGLAQSTPKDANSLHIRSSIWITSTGQLVGATGTIVGTQGSVSKFGGNFAPGDVIGMGLHTP